MSRGSSGRSGSPGHEDRADPDGTAPDGDSDDVRASGNLAPPGPLPAWAVWLIAAVAMFAIVALAEDLLEPASYSRPEWEQYAKFPGDAVLRGWIRWDAGWYKDIATIGYSYQPNVQSSVAYFPLYPLLIRILGNVMPHVYDGAILITAASGFAATLMFSRWCREHLSRTEAWTALLCLIVYPYAFYLFGAVYADALFLALVLAAFLSLEHDRPILAGVFGLLATATRPTGVAVLFGLAVLVLERRHVIGATADSSVRLRARFRQVRARDFGVLLSGGGIAAYMTYLWVTFGDPMAFAAAESAPGWDHDPGPTTWFKVRVWDLIQGTVAEPTGYLETVLFQGLIAVGCLVAVPAIIRRFGWGYGVYVAMVVGSSALSSKDFMGLGRYATAAFPVYAILGIWLCSRPAIRRPALVVSGCVAVFATSLFARGYYIA